jgi:hypothetical protein
MEARQHIDISKFLNYIARNNLKVANTFILFESERKLSITMILDLWKILLA